MFWKINQKRDLETLDALLSLRLHSPGYFPSLNGSSVLPSIQLIQNPVNLTGTIRDDNRAYHLSPSLRIEGIHKSPLNS